MNTKDWYQAGSLTFGRLAQFPKRVVSAPVVVRGIGVLGLVGTLLVVQPGQAAVGAQGCVSVRVTALRALSEFDNESGADLFAKVWIGGKQVGGKAGVFKRCFSALSHTDIKIEVWDDDDFLNGGDDRADIEPGRDNDLELSVDVPGPGGYGGLVYNSDTGHLHNLHPILYTRADEAVTFETRGIGYEGDSRDHNARIEFQVLAERKP